MTCQRMTRITGKHIAEGMNNFLHDNGLNVENVRWQGYDGASNMFSSRAGVQGRFKEVAPLGMYVHCCGHCLNLVIGRLSSLPEIRNFLDRLKNCCRTFLESSKKNGLLEAVVLAKVTDTIRRHPILDLC